MSGQSQFPWREKLFTNFAARAAVYKPNQAYDQLCYNSPSHEFHRAIVGLVRNHKPPSLPRPLNIAGNLQFNYTMPVTIVALSTDCLANTNTPVFWVKSVDVSAWGLPAGGGLTLRCVFHVCLPQLQGSNEQHQWNVPATVKINYLLNTSANHRAI